MVPKLRSPAALHRLAVPSPAASAQNSTGPQPHSPKAPRSGIHGAESLLPASAWGSSESVSPSGIDVFLKKHFKKVVCFTRPRFLAPGSRARGRRASACPMCRRLHHRRASARLCVWPHRRRIPVSKRAAPSQPCAYLTSARRCIAQHRRCKINTVLCS